MVTALKSSELNGLPLFHGLTDSDLALVEGALRSIRFPIGAVIFNVDQPGDVAYVILEGTLRVSSLRQDGSEVILALLGPGEIVGELSLVDQGGRSADVIAIEPCKLLWFDRRTYQRFKSTIPRLSDNLVALLARRLRLANDHIQALATLDVQGRVARQLLALADVYGRLVPAGIEIDVRLTQSDLAALCGATRVRVNQSLGTFKKLGYLTEDSRHRITIVNRVELASYCE